MRSRLRPQLEIVVLGASGFVGSAICRALRGHSLTTVPAPRLQTEARTIRELNADLGSHEAEIRCLADAFEGKDAVVNAAGLALPNGLDGDSLYGANALLVKLLAEAFRRSGSHRLVHVSSASVQGDLDVLDESDRYRARTPYAISKSLGERVLLDEELLGFTILRPTSVHGAERSLTRQLVRFARSPVACVAAPGSAPTPQVLVSNVGEAVAYLASCSEAPPPIVLQPSEGWSTSSFLHRLSGRNPLLIPRGLARSGLNVASILSRFAPLVAYQRRLELLWMGQDQVESWLDRVGFRVPDGPEAWVELVRQIDSIRKHVSANWGSSDGSLGRFHR